MFFEKEDKGAVSGCFDPANPQKAYIDGVEIVIPKVDGKFVDNAANVLVNNGYTVTGMFGSPATYWATKGGNTYFFTVKDPAPEYYTLTVDGTVVEYIKSSEASTTTWKQVKDAAKGGAGMLVNGTYAAYTDKIDTDKVVTGTSAATVIKTGYVGVTNSITGSDPAIVVDSYAKANSTFTVKATYSTVANANEEVVLTYDGTKTVTVVADTARKVFTFAKISRYTPPFTITPFLAAERIPPKNAVDTDIPIAHGQAAAKNTTTLFIPVTYSYVLSNRLGKTTSIAADANIKPT